MIVALTMMVSYFTFRQSFSSGSFESFEETYEGLISKDPENKKLILDQVNINHIISTHNLSHLAFADIPRISLECSFADIHQGPRYSSL